MSSCAPSEPNGFVPLASPTDPAPSGFDKLVHEEIPILEIPAEIPDPRDAGKTVPNPALPDPDNLFSKWTPYLRSGKKQVDLSKLPGFGERSMHPLFRNFTFKSKLSLEDDYVFPHGISFVNCDFQDEVSFKAAIFTGPAYFWNCRFHHKFSFFRVLVSDACCKVQMREDGEVNFSYCVFNFTTRPKEFTQPSFDRATLHGKAYFHRTVFANGLRAEECRFKGGVFFDSSGGDICLHENEIDFLPEPIRKTLTSEIPRILSTNTDQKDHLDFDAQIDSEKSFIRAVIRSLNEQKRRQEGLPGKPQIPNTGFNRMRSRFARSKARLQRPKAGQNSLGQLEAQLQELGPAVDFGSLRCLWRTGYNAEMFGGIEAQRRPEWLTSFRGSYFGDNSRFSHVTLSNCRFLGARLENVTFSVVDWVRQPCGILLRKFPGFFLDLSQRPLERGSLLYRLRHGYVPLVSWRSALLDELQVDRHVLEVGNESGRLQTGRTELSELYHEVRVIYDRQGDGQVARDFYFGELEASRLGKGFITRQLGLLNLYRIFSGYSKREGLALAWLLFYILGLFPLGFYFWVNRQERQAITPAPPAAVFHLSWVGTPRTYFPPPPRPMVFPATCRLSTPTVITAKPPDDAGTAASVKRADQERFGDALARMLDTVDGHGTPWDRLVRVMGSSLQASTFLPTSVQNGSIDAAVQVLHQIRCSDDRQQDFYSNSAERIAGRERRRRLLEAIERTAVTAQLALFLLALRSKFQRTH